MKADRGFRVLQLLIVVALILMIAALAIPSLIRSRTASQDSSAGEQIRPILPHLFAEGRI